jgi:hypothetical protein
LCFPKCLILDFSPIIHFEKFPVQKFQLLIPQPTCAHPRLKYLLDFL